MAEDPMIAIMERVAIAAPAPRLPTGMQLVQRSPRPGTPAFAAMIPPGAPDPVDITSKAEAIMAVEAPAVNGTVASTVKPGQRLVISYGPHPAKLVVAIETAPDWDIEESFMVTKSALIELEPILRALVKCRDLTGGYAFTPEVPNESA